MTQEKAEKAVVWLLLCCMWHSSQGPDSLLSSAEGLNTRWLKLRVGWRAGVLWQSWSTGKCLFSPPL